MKESLVGKGNNMKIHMSNYLHAKPMLLKTFDKTGRIGKVMEMAVAYGVPIIVALTFVKEYTNSKLYDKAIQRLKDFYEIEEVISYE